MGEMRVSYVIDGICLIGNVIFHAHVDSSTCRKSVYRTTIGNCSGNGALSNSRSRTGNSQLS